MKRLFALPCALMFVLLLSVVAHAEWTPINDELDIDYQTYQIRLFVSGKNYNSFDAMARKMALEYVATLTDGKDNLKLADVFKTRKPMAAKVQALLKGNVKAQYSASKMDDDSHTQYWFFDLNLLKSLFPEINMPTP